MRFFIGCGGSIENPVRHELQSNQPGHEDVEAIGDYTARRWSLERAERIVSDIRQEFRRLGEMPWLGHFRDDVTDRRYKFWLIHSFLIAYRWEAQPIDIVAVVHGARDLPTFFEERLK